MTRTWRSAAVVALLTLGVFCGDVSAQGRGQGRGRSGADNGGGRESGVAVEVVFRAGDRAAFRDYIVTHKIAAQPLPPGIAKNVARGKPLPPGIAKRALPAGLLAIAPRKGKDVSFAIVGDVIVATKGGVVIDVLAGVFK